MPTPFDLPEELTIYTAVETRDALLAWLGAGGAHDADDAATRLVSGQRVREVDGAGLQLLLSLGHLDQPWRLVQASAALTDTLHLMGLDAWLKQFSR